MFKKQTKTMGFMKNPMAASEMLVAGRHLFGLAIYLSWVWVWRYGFWLKLRQCKFARQDIPSIEVVSFMLPKSTEFGGTADPKYLGKKETAAVAIIVEWLTCNIQGIRVKPAHSPAGPKEKGPQSAASARTHGSFLGKPPGFRRCLPFHPDSPHFLPFLAPKAS